MHEFGLLLKDAAGVPPRPLNMAAIHARAAQLGWRRRAGLWVSAVLAVLGVGIPAGVSVVSTGDRPEGVRTTIDDDGASEPRAPDEPHQPGRTEEGRPGVVGATPGSLPTGPPAGVPGVGGPGNGFEHVAALGLSGRLAYTRAGATEAESQIHILDLATGRDEALRRGFSPDFSHDGSRVAYISLPAGVGDRLGALRVIGADGRGDRQVYAFQDRSIDWPSWSPDGDQLAFLASQPGGGWPVFHGATGLPSIWVVNADGTNARELTELADHDPGAPDWAPDGRSLAWEASHGRGGPAAYVYDFDSGRARRVAAGRSPAWAPDSKRLSVVREVPDPPDPVTGAPRYRHVIDIVNVETNAIERTIGEGSRHTLWAPTWSPDGRWIAVAGSCASSSASAGTALCVVRADGRDMSVVVPGDVRKGYWEDPSWGRAPRW